MAAEEGVIDLDEPAGPPGSTMRHLLSHASGLPFDAGMPVGRPGAKRVYSNPGIELVAETVGEPRRDAVRALSLRSGAAAAGAGCRAARLTRRGPLRVAGRPHALCRGAASTPTLIAPETLAEATTVQFPGLAGVVPDLGRFDPNDWGLGFELKDGKQPHWSGSRTSPRTFGHFGGSGTFLWVDPDVGLALCCLTDREFGPWAMEAWPKLSTTSSPRPMNVDARSLVVREERADELVERCLVAARHDRRRHGPHGRRARHAHRQRHLSEVRAGVQHARCAAPSELLAASTPDSTT